MRRVWGCLLALTVVLSPATIAVAQDLYEEPSASTRLIAALLSWAPLLILIVLWWVFFKALRPKRQKELQDRSLQHMARAEEHMQLVEAKLDEMINLLRK